MGRTRFLLRGLLLAALLGAASRSEAQTISPEFRAEVLKLQDVTGSHQLALQVANTLSRNFMEGLKQAQPGVPARALEITQQAIMDEIGRAFADPDGLPARTVSIYAEHFTLQDVRGMIAFYESELGRKMVSEMPAITRQSAVAAQQFAEERLPSIMTTVLERLRSEGFVK